MSVPVLEGPRRPDGRRVLVVDFNVPLSTAGSRPASAAPCPPCTGCRSRAPRSRSHLGLDRRAPDPRTRWTRCGPASRSWRRASSCSKNLRLQPGRTANDPAFVQELIAGRDAYVNDGAFRSVAPGPRLDRGPLPARPLAPVAREAEVLLGVRNDRHPFVAILGGPRSATSWV